MKHFDIMPNQLIFKRAFFGKELQEWIEFDAADPRLETSWEYERPPMDDRGRLYLWQRHPVFNAILAEMTLIPVFSEEENDEGLYPVIGYQIEDSKINDVIYKYTFSGLSENAASIEIRAEIGNEDIDLCTATVTVDSAGILSDQTEIYWKNDAFQELEESVENFIDQESQYIEIEIDNERKRQHRNDDLIPEDGNPLP